MAESNGNPLLSGSSARSMRNTNHYSRFSRTSGIEPTAIAARMFLTGQTPSSSASSNATLNNDSFDYLKSLFASEAQAMEKNMQYNAEQARIVREYNANEAKKLRDWQEKMSNTAYQRAMKDMMASGLNPILAFSQGGASVPTGSSASANNAFNSSTAGTDIAELLSAIAKLLGPLGGALIGALMG